MVGSANSKKWEVSALNENENNLQVSRGRHNAYEKTGDDGK